MIEIDYFILCFALFFIYIKLIVFNLINKLIFLYNNFFVYNFCVNTIFMFVLISRIDSSKVFRKKINYRM